MSVVIDNTDDLLALTRKLGVKVTSVDEVRQLLTTVNANYNPHAARLRTAKLVALGVPCGLGGMAAVVSLFLTFASQGGLAGHYFVGALALVWGSFALVSVTALIFSFALLLGRQARVPADAPPAGKTTRIDGPLVTAITPELSL
ncbi:MAG TPA: hypothetical protein VH643_16810 [Gemmataceae bacterium]|jgi:hypothetical protein